MRKLLIIFSLFPLILNAQLKDKMYGIWDFEDTSIADSSGNGNTGTIVGTVGITDTNGKLGNYANFTNQSNSWIELDDTCALSNSFSIGFWIKWDGNNDDYVIGRFYGDFSIYINADGDWAYTVFSNYYSTNDAASSGTWTHIVFTYDNSLGSNNIKFYIDGVLSEQDNETATETFSNDEWQIGTNGNNGYHLSADLDQLFFSREVLVADEIDTIYNDGDGLVSSLWTPASASSGYDFDEQMYSSDLGIGFYPINSATGEPFQIFEYTPYTEPSEPPVSGDGDSINIPLPDYESVYFASTHQDTITNTTSELETLVESLGAGDTLFIEVNSVFYEFDVDISSVTGTAVNPVVIMAYGEGIKPKITGYKNLTNTFTQNGNIWTSTGVGYSVPTSWAGLDDPDIVNFQVSGLSVDSRYRDVSRLPESGYYYTNTKGGGSSTSITDANRSWSNDTLIEGIACFHLDEYSLYISRITDNTSTGLTMSGLGVGEAKNLYKDTTRYFITNIYDGLLSNYDWAYRNNNLYVYYSGNLNSRTVEMPVIDMMWDIDNSEYFEFHNIDFRGVNLIAFDLNSSDNFTFDDCNFEIIGTAILLEDGGDLIVQNSSFRDIQTHALLLKSAGDVDVLSNTFDKVYFNEGMTNQFFGWNGCVAQQYMEGDLVVQYNIADSITIFGQNHQTGVTNPGTFLYDRNVITNFNKLHLDCAAIYNGGDPADVSKVISNNIIIDGIYEFDKAPDLSSGGADNFGIYFDYDTRYITATNNLIVNTGTGIVCNRTLYHEITDNTIVRGDIYARSNEWKSAIRIDANVDDGQWRLTGHTITGNTIYLNDDQYSTGILWHQDVDPDYIFDWTTFTDTANVYHDAFTPTGDQDIAAEMTNYVFDQRYTIAEMNSRRTGANSVPIENNSTFNAFDWTFDDVSGIDEDEFYKVVYNPTNTQADVSIGDDYDYYDIEGNEYTGTVTLSAWEYKVLLFKNL